MGEEMNERIKELYNEASEQFKIVQDQGLPAPYQTRVFAEKFAELIVQECAGIAYEYDIPNLTGPGEFIGNRMKKHFGVE